MTPLYTTLGYLKEVSGCPGEIMWTPESRCELSLRARRMVCRVNIRSDAKREAIAFLFRKAYLMMTSMVAEYVKS
jgi:hypothetical protein